MIYFGTEPWAKEYLQMSLVRVAEPERKYNIKKRKKAYDWIKKENFILFEYETVYAIG